MTSDILFKFVVISYTAELICETSLLFYFALYIIVELVTLLGGLFVLANINDQILIISRA